MATGIAKSYFQWHAANQRLRIAQTIETQRAQAERQLQALVGVHAIPALEPMPLPTPTALPDAAVRLDLLARRPEIAAARDRVQATLKEVESQRAAFYPDVSLGALAGLDVRRADVALAVAQYDQALQQAVADVNDATVRVQGAQREAAPLAAQTRARERDLASARLRAAAPRRAPGARTARCRRRRPGRGGAAPRSPQLAGTDSIAAEDLQHAKQTVTAAQDALTVAEKTSGSTPTSRSRS